MFFLAESGEIRGKAYLRFDFLLAISVVVIRDDRDHHDARIPANQLERVPVVVLFFCVAPAHSLRLLALGGLVVVRQADTLLFYAGQMRSKDYASRVARPMHYIEGRVVFRKVWIATVLEDAFHEIKIANGTAGAKKRVSMVFAASDAVAGHTRGRSRRLINS